MIRELHNENFKEGKLGYILYTPEKVEKNMPLIVFLHGAGERGSNLDHVERLNIPKMIKEGHELDAVVLCPQCPGEFVWNNLVREVKKLIDEIAEEYQSDKSRISITGS
ncbi:MAG: alpha/beta hydrolase, partial [Lachnospiraceae bacterium]|nr:alpha/beta hydrolase [Lachnospiraceae bacterium]